jgi:hypothetical protein
MLAEPLQSTFLNDFADLVHEKRDEIGRQWMREVRR